MRLIYSRPILKFNISNYNKTKINILLNIYAKIKNLTKVESFFKEYKIFKSYKFYF